MSQQKYQPTGQDVDEFIASIESDRKRQDAQTLLELFTEVSGYDAKMWYPNIIGFGQYHYKYASGREGDATYLGFSPRKAKISLYILAEFEGRDELLVKLGKHTRGKACVYVNKLADIDLNVLKELLERSLAYTKELYPE